MKTRQHVIIEIKTDFISLLYQKEPILFCEKTSAMITSMEKSLTLASSKTSPCIHSQSF